MAYDTGDLVRVGNWSGNTETEAFALLNGTATDPTAVLLTVKTPDPDPETLDLVYGWPDPGADGTLTHESAGRFYADIAMTLAGVWYWRLAGTGAVTAAAEGAFYVQASNV